MCPLVEINVNLISHTYPEEKKREREKERRREREKERERKKERKKGKKEGRKEKKEADAFSLIQQKGNVQCLSLSIFLYST